MPDVEAQPDAAPRRLAHHSQQQPPADTLPAPIRRDADRDLGRARIDIEGRFLLGCELPRPSRADRAGISFGDKAEVLRLPPLREMRRNERHRLRSSNVGLIGGDGEKTPKDRQIVREGRTKADPGLMNRHR